MLNQARIISFSQEQGELLPTYPSDLVPEDHYARAVNDIIDFMDLTVLYGQYDTEGGQAFHPKAFLKILFYGYSEGTQSSRRLSKACCENYVYMFSGHGIKPDFRTISEFCRKNLDILNDLFKQIVGFCKKLGMIETGNVSLDGTKIKANASNKAIIQKDHLKRELSSIESEIDSYFEEAEKIDRLEDQKFGPNNSGTQLPEKIKKAHERKKQIQLLLDEMVSWFSGKWNFGL